MIRIAALLALLYALAGCAADPAGEGREGHASCAVREMAVLPIRFEHDTILVPARINDVDTLMGVDTGSSGTVLNANAARVLHLPEDAHRVTIIHGVGGTITTRNVLVRSFEFGGLTGPPRSFAIGLLSKSFSPSITVSGTLGAFDFADFDVELDVPNQRMTLWLVNGCTGSFVKWNEPYFAVPLSRDRGGLMHATVYVNGQPVHALIDWGARGTVITRTAARRIGVTDAMLDHDIAGHAEGVDQNEIPARRHDFDEIRIGSDSLRPPRISVAELDWKGSELLLGMDYAKTRHIWLSYGTHQMFVAPGDGKATSGQ
jgi:predicted aspartyl protease